MHSMQGDYRKMIAPRIFAAAALAAMAGAAHAEFDKAMAAARQGNAQAAFVEMLDAAEKGDARAYAPLASQYLRGIGTRRDLRAAQNWAAKAAQTGDPAGEFVFYEATVSLPELNFIDAKGGIDRDRYKALAARPISAREDEMTAYDALWSAVEKGNQEASLALAGYFADNVGEGNRARAIAVLDKAPRLPGIYANLRKALGELDAFGPTLVTLRLRDEVLPAAANVARTAAAEKDAAKKECKDARPVRTQRLGPLTQAVWLPLAAADMRQSYLMAGVWREIWTFDVCGAETPVRITFTGDGLGSATFAVDK
jgi:TPR repeat protein